MTQEELDQLMPPLGEKYHMRWRNPQDLNPECLFD